MKRHAFWSNRLQSAHEPLVATTHRRCTISATGNDIGNIDIRRIEIPRDKISLESSNNNKTSKIILLIYSIKISEPVAVVRKLVEKRKSS